MASTSLELEAIKEYLVSVGCKIEYPILVNAFKKHLYNPDPSVQGRVRTQFKDYVNRLATVSLESNMKFIILRPEFRPPDRDRQSRLSSGGGRTSPPRELQPLGQFVTAETSQAPVEASRPTTGRRLQAATEPGRSSSNPNQVQPPVMLTPPQQLQKIPLRSPQPCPPSHIDPRDSLQYVQHQQSSQHYHPGSQDSPPSPLRQHNHDAMNRFREPIHANYYQTRTNNWPVQSHATDNAQQQKSLPPTPQLHQRTQSQPATSQTHFQYNKQDYPSHNQQQHQVTHSPLALTSNNVVDISHLHDDSAFLMPPPPPPHSSEASKLHLTSSPLRAPHSSNRRQDTPILTRAPSTVSQQQGPPPRPPPRRRQSTASLFKPSPTRPIEKLGRESFQEQARKGTLNRVREHASRFNSSASTSDLTNLMPKRNSSMKENRLSRESVFSGLIPALQRNGSQTRSRSSHRGEDESDSSSLQPIDPLRRRWAIEACSCNYNNLVSLLREDPKLAACKDIVNGYTALHWAAKFGNLDIIKLIAGTHQISANTKSSAGLTPLHVAFMFDRLEAASMLIQSYRANQDVRDHSGRRPRFYSKTSSA